MLRPAIPRLHSLSLKYVDDLSILSPINLRKSLVPDSELRVKPLTKNERTGQVLPSENNILQDQLHDLKRFTDQKLLNIKERKTNLMKFNFAKIHDFPPELKIDGFKNDLEVVKETKLLGMILTNDLKWSANTEYICKKAYKKMWTL